MPAEMYRQTQTTLALCKDRTAVNRGDEQAGQREVCEAIYRGPTRRVGRLGSNRNEDSSAVWKGASAQRLNGQTAIGPWPDALRACSGVCAN